MTSRARVIGAIFKKDVLSLWPMALASAGLTVGWGFLDAEAHEDPNLAILAALLGVMAVLGAIVLVAMVVHLDPAAGARSDWRTRPVRRLDLILAKHLLIVPALFLPLLAADVLRGANQGYSAGEIASDLAGPYLWMGVAPALIAFAGVTETLIGTIILLAMCVVAALGFNVAVSEFLNASYGGFASAAQTWIVGLLSMPLMIAVGVGLLWTEYGKSRPRLAGGMIVFACLIGPFVFGALVPFSAAWTVTRTLAGESAAARAVTAHIDLRCLAPEYEVGSHAKAPAGPRFGAIMAVANFGGLSPGARLAIDHEDGDYKTAGGRLFASPMSQGFRLTHAASAEGFSFQPFRLNMALRRGTPASVPLRLHYALTLLQPVAHFEIAADGERRAIPGFGYCAAKQTPLGLNYNCLKTGAQPDLIYFSVKGAAGETCANCRPDYTPDIFEFPGGRRYQGEVQGLAAQQLIITTYRAAAHFDRSAFVTPASISTLPDCPTVPLPQITIPGPETGA